jgi:hypothetical protein
MLGQNQPTPDELPSDHDMSYQLPPDQLPPDQLPPDQLPPDRLPPGQLLNRPGFIGGS